jgi:hypothetical protein
MAVFKNWQRGEDLHLTKVRCYLPKFITPNKNFPTQIQPLDETKLILKITLL